ncbi:conserved hypothetical protein [Xenorhabdus bovienii str. puntauvense]|uniref:Uncharacterized protein n=3 Tax=Xenorhabdus bovienii TaxID=40576 RepID=A0A0B6XCF1_XENBV|nr:conserved hypothetical protein [Xenorhabdus bovienii str. feltiae France]CDG94826.1 conserved hypothetical protein [Xenorhabdus bovienii str. feltiae Florida]CDG99068.1 conserved hypothetical protein [Xenorhabdus bovienii str. puntauvense]CDH03530.1 conserved hypothetical protein [Xenorhabdus bovienii str. feltiae Moldova]CDM91532.1 conserved protein of unknown function [Xenorhabdus bovienii]
MKDNDKVTLISNFIVDLNSYHLVLRRLIIDDMNGLMTNLT